MKHFVFIVMMAAGLIASNAASAQKTGYISLGELIQSMPEYKKADTSLMEFRSALGEQYSSLVDDFNKKRDELNSADTIKWNKAQMDVKRKSLEELYEKLTSWEGTAREQAGRREEELVAPIHKKALEAVNAVAKEAGYTYVYNKEALLVCPPADDLLPLVKKKLGIK